MTYNYLQHYGIQGMKWGRRRYQNHDGSLTPAGRVRYGIGVAKKTASSKLKKVSSAVKSSVSRLNKMHDDRVAANKEKIIRSGKWKTLKKHQNELTDEEYARAVQRINMVNQSRGRSALTSDLWNKLDTIKLGTDKTLGYIQTAGKVAKLLNAAAEYGPFDVSKGTKKTLDMMSKILNSTEPKNGDVDGSAKKDKKDKKKTEEKPDETSKDQSKKTDNKSDETSKDSGKKADNKPDEVNKEPDKKPDSEDSSTKALPAHNKAPKSEPDTKLDSEDSSVKALPAHNEAPKSEPRRPVDADKVTESYEAYSKYNSLLYKLNNTPTSDPSYSKLRADTQDALEDWKRKLG